MADKLSALIIAKPGQWRESLRVLLLGIAHICAVNLAETDTVKLGLDPEQKPALVLVDFEPGSNTLQKTLHEIKAAWPATLCIVLIENDAERRAVTKWGGDLVLKKGLLAARLAASIEEALAHQTGR